MANHEVSIKKNFTRGRTDLMKSIFRSHKKVTKIVSNAFSEDSQQFLVT